MSDPTPLTDEELDRLRKAALGFGKPFTGGLFMRAEVARLLATVDAERARAEQAEAERDELRIAIHGGCGCPVPYDQCTHEEPLLQVVNRRWEQIQTLTAERDELAAQLQAVLSEGLTADGFRRKYLAASPTEGNPE